MKKHITKLSPDDFSGMLEEDQSFVYFRFWQLRHEEYEEELRLDDKPVKLLSLDDIKNHYNVDTDAAQKLYQYQAGYVQDFQRSFDELGRKIPRYLKVKSYRDDKKYAGDILSDYVDFTGSAKDFEKSFNPMRNLVRSLSTRFLSLAIYVIAILSGVRITSWFDWFSVLILVLVSLMWLGATFQGIFHIPSEYRSRKIVYSLRLKEQPQD